MSMSRVAVVISLLTSYYPLAFTGALDGVLDLVGVASIKRTPQMLDVLTLVLLAGVTLCAYSVRDLRLIFSLGEQRGEMRLFTCFQPTCLFNVPRRCRS